MLELWTTVPLSLQKNVLMQLKRLGKHAVNLARHPDDPVKRKIGIILHQVYMNMFNQTYQIVGVDALTQDELVQLAWLFSTSIPEFVQSFNEEFHGTVLNNTIILASKYHWHGHSNMDIAEVIFHEALHIYRASTNAIIQQWATTPSMINSEQLTIMEEQMVYAMMHIVRYPTHSLPDAVQAAWDKMQTGTYGSAATVEKFFLNVQQLSQSIMIL